MKMEEQPVVSRIQKLVLYETKQRFYIVGSNHTETSFRVLKIDRTEPRELHIQDDKHVYTASQIQSLLTMIESGNRATSRQKGNLGLTKTVSAYGIVGFVRFLEGYYIILITKRKKIALIGSHTIYKIEDTSLLYIPNDSIRYTHPDENRYVKMFLSVDLSSNFYFSYSYDLTHSLQYNMAPSVSLCPPPSDRHRSRSTSPRPQTKAAPPGPYKKPRNPCDSELEDTGSLPFILEAREEGQQLFDRKEHKDKTVYGVKNGPAFKYVWNKHLLSTFEDDVHHDWVLYIIYGYLDQSNVCIYGKSIYITLIARRSNEFAGTRFQKRGASSQGAVANEVETEQIVHDASITKLEMARLSSFVQMRGSVPVYWSQDVSKVVTRPPITLDQRDPYFHTAGLHFNSCLKRYGAPVILLNLIKRREKRTHESILCEEYRNAVSFLNQFLSPDHKMVYIGFDMAHHNKSKTKNVLVRLARIARYCVKQTGFYLSIPEMEIDDFWEQHQFVGVQGQKTHTGCRQTGVVRTNCVDCLDRTNTAQFAVGKCALAYQLCALGVLEDPDLDFDTDCLKILEELYEDQGDTVALQYGGSQLVHRIEGYRKIAPWKSHSRDIMQTISRYYSNTFSDVEKQQATNVFLGLFVPKEGQSNIWDLATDFYLHNPDAAGVKVTRRSYTSWCERHVFSALPLPYDEVSKTENPRNVYVKVSPTDECVDSFFEYYKPYELTNLEQLYCSNMSHSIRNFMPKGSKNYSPFIRRAGPESLKDSRCDHMKTIKQELNPNISGKDSTSSMTSHTSEEGSSSSDSSVEADVNISEDSDSDVDQELPTYQTSATNHSFHQTTAENVYGLNLTNPPDVEVYQRYVELGVSCLDQTHVSKSMNLDPVIVPLTDYNDCFITEPPVVSRDAVELYTNYVRRRKEGATSPSPGNQDIYKEYVRKRYK